MDSKGQFLTFNPKRVCLDGLTDKRRYRYKIGSQTDKDRKIDRYYLKEKKEKENRMPRKAIIVLNM